MKLHNFALVVGLKLHSRNKLDFMFYLEVRSHFQPIFSNTCMLYYYVNSCILNPPDLVQ